MSTPLPSEEPTLRVDPGTPTVPRPSGRAQYAPGEIIAGRYRIVTLLGSGGMGDVYRADDIKLDQPVALKFLPPALARDTVLLARLHDEVRLGRQVSHPNVCRIYDIGEFGQAHFVAMEFVDGEDLARLLRRIGRLPVDKAVEIAHGVTAGLAAAHAKGILHRDLKPANVMIDGHGVARITDFGLALATSDSGFADLAGTPAYMAPEQLAGKPASERSDLFALGLVLYEMITGRRAPRDAPPPSSFVRDIDPALERVILRCLSRDPDQRPASAREVLRALPGGDPIAAAIAAGETPSPRAVAAAGTEGTLSPKRAWLLAAIIGAAYAGIVVQIPRSTITRRVPFDKPPEVLDARAAEIATALGLDAPRFHTGRLWADETYLGWIVSHDRSMQRWDRFAHAYPPLLYEVRFAPEPLLPRRNIAFPTHDDPPLDHGGMANVTIDTSGRLMSLAAIPAKARAGRADFRSLLALAGFDLSRLTPTPARDVVPIPANQRAAWSAMFGSVPVRIEAAALDATPVWLHVAVPWESDATARSATIFNDVTLQAIIWPLFTATALFAAFLVWNNYRRRRIDRSGAMRLAIVAFVLEAATFLLQSPHSIDFGRESATAQRAAAISLYWAAAYAFLYLAFEPYVRRRWPELLISWSRLFAGKWRDPMVGRDVLLGTAGGVLHALLALSSSTLPARLGLAPELLPRIGQLGAYRGIRAGIAIMLGTLSSAIIVGLVLAVIIVGLGVLLRRRSFAGVAFFVLNFAIFYVLSRGAPYAIPFYAAICAITTLLLVRVGLLAIVAFYAAFDIAFSMPQPIDPTSWAFADTLVGTISLALIVVFAFRIALGSQPAFSASLLDG